MDNPFFTVILPCFNAESFIDEAISSVRSQSFGNLEMIIVDDGSTDTSWDIISKAARLDGRIQHIQIERSGVSEARNRGLSVAKGSFITFIDADDVMEKNALASYYSIVSKQEVDLVIGSAFQFSSSIMNRSYRRKLVGPNFYRGKELSLISKNFLRGDFDHANWNKLYRLEKINSSESRFDSRLLTGQDLMFNWVYWNHIETVCLLSSPVMNYRRHPKSAWRNRTSQFEKFKMLIDVFEEKKHNFTPQSLKICSAYLSELFWYYKLPEFLKSDETKLLDKIKKIILTAGTQTIQDAKLVGNLKMKILQVVLKLSTVLHAKLVKKNYNLTSDAP
jgi:glycosyltransferase involved in cell wall biosynthesis